jgi:hypothetical protein
MTRTTLLLLLGIPVILAQMPEKPDLLKRTDELERLIAAGEWDRAAESSRSLKDVVTEARNRSLAADGNQLADSILKWLPPDTETFVVAQQPFPITKQDQTVIPTALQMAQGYVLGFLHEAEHGKLGEATLSRTVRLAAFGAKNFRNHTPGKDNILPLGMIAFEGCSIYAFAQPLSDTIFARPPDELLMGYQVWVSKGTQNDLPDTDTLLVSMLQPDLVMVCNNREFFRQVVSRKDAPQTPRALPETLPEWKQVNRAAGLWAICHYRPDGLILPGAVIPQDGADPEATGITVAFGLPSGASKARMMSKLDPWTALANSPEFRGAAKSSKAADGVWELSVSGNPEAATMSAFALMALVGFVVLL